MYTESEKAAEKADKSQLKTRLRFHLAHKFGDEKKLMSFHQELEDVVEDQVGFSHVRHLKKMTFLCENVLVKKRNLSKNALQD